MLGKSPRPLHKDETGATAIIVALSITAIVGILAIVGDVGYMYEMRRQLQSAADGAALAGMTQKINGGSDADVMAIAEDYASRNDYPKDVGTPLALQVLDSPPDTEITESYVKIGVQKHADYFFAPIFDLIGGFSDRGRMIRAQARANRVYLTGARGMMPWGVGTIRASRVTATVGGVTTELSYDSGAGEWTGSLPVPAAAATAGYPVDVTLYNSQNFPEVLSNVSSLTVHQAGDTVSDVYLQDNTLSPGASTYLYVEATAVPSAQIDRDRYPESAFASVGTGLYRATVSAPAATDPLVSYPVSVSAGGTTYDNAAVLVVRQPTYPMEELQLGQAHWAAGGATTSITVKLGDFEYGELYDLKILSDAEAGNFNALDFRYIYHPPGYTLNEGQNDSAADYYDNLGYAYPGVVHIGDIITTKTGNLSEPVTTNSLETRFEGCSYSFSDWEAAGKPGSCGRLVTVPIVERIERVTGQTDVMVVAMAAFFVEQYERVDSTRVNITGRFVEYARTGESSDEPPSSGLYMETVRLDSPDY